LSTIQPAIQIHPPGRIRAFFLPVLRLPVEDLRVIRLRVEGVCVFDTPVDAGFLPLGGIALVDEAGGCVPAEELGEVETVRGRGDAFGREGQGVACVAVGAV